MSDAVFVVDYEPVSPIAIGRHSLFRALDQNVRAESDLESGLSDYPFHKAARINSDLTNYWHDASSLVQLLCCYDRKFELLVSCFQSWATRSGALIELLGELRSGVICGVGADSIPLEQYSHDLNRYLRANLDPTRELLASGRQLANGINPFAKPYDVHAIYLAEACGAAAFQETVLTACVSSTQAMVQASEKIRRGLADCVVVAGTDSILNPLALTSFGKLGVIPDQHQNADPCCRPFDVNRRGTLAGEAAGIAVLASAQVIERFRIEPLARIAGTGNTLDAYRITAPDPSGDSIVRAMNDAMGMTGWNAGQVDYIHAHGTGTIQNDELEGMCWKRTLGEEIGRIPMSSTKNRHGHAIAAAGIQEICVVLNCMENKLIPGNIDTRKPCNEHLNLPLENQKKPIRHVLKSNLAFGGINTVLALTNECL